METMRYLFNFELSEKEADRLLTILSDYRNNNDVQAVMVSSYPALAKAYVAYSDEATSLIDKILDGRRRIEVNQ